MITTSILADFLIWTVFWLIVLYAAYWGLRDLEPWLDDELGGGGIRNFPRESLGEPGPEKPASPDGGQTGKQDGRRSGRHGQAGKSKRRSRSLHV